MQENERPRSFNLQWMKGLIEAISKYNFFSNIFLDFQQKIVTPWLDQFNSGLYIF